MSTRRGEQARQELPDSRGRTSQMGEEPSQDQTLTRGPTSRRGWEPVRIILTQVGPHHLKVRNPAHVSSNQRTHITKGLGVRQAGVASQHRAHNIKNMRIPAFRPSSRRPRTPRLWDPGHSELTAEGPHHKTVSNPGVGTSAQKAHIPMEMGT